MTVRRIREKIIRTDSTDFTNHDRTVSSEHLRFLVLVSSLFFLPYKPILCRVGRKTLTQSISRSEMWRDAAYS